jgi:GNAT superfamily N-acetyltransferase
MIDERDIVLQPTAVHYLRMNARPSSSPSATAGVSLEPLDRPVDVDYYLELYQQVGLHFNWVDRLLLPRSDLHGIINSVDTHVYLLFHDGQPCGFTELVCRVDSVEIQYFGLFQEYIGKGLGAPCLRATVNEAWTLNPEWLELNTCDLDHARALDLYQKVGFTLYSSRTELRRRFH